MPASILPSFIDNCPYASTGPFAGSMFEISFYLYKDCYCLSMINLHELRSLATHDAPTSCIQEQRKSTLEPGAQGSSRTMGGEAAYRVQHLSTTFLSLPERKVNKRKRECPQPTPPPPSSSPLLFLSLPERKKKQKERRKSTF